MNRTLNSPDTLYAMSTTGLWSNGEMTAGFLIIGITSLPKVVKSIPLTKSVMSLIRSWKRTGQNGMQGNPRRGLPSWYKLQSRKHYKKTDYSDLDQYDLIFTKSTISAGHPMPDTITRQVHAARTPATTATTNNGRRFDPLRTV